MNKNQITQKLSNLLGLSSKESLIYSELLGFRSGVSVAILSDRTTIPRGTLYGLLKIMTNRGILQETKVGGKHFRPTPLPELKHLLELQAQQAQQNIAEFHDIEKYAQTILQEPITHPKFTYTEGMTGMIQTYYSALQNQEKFIRAIFPESSVIETLGKNTVEDFKEQRKLRGIQVRTLVAKKNVVRDSLLESSVKNNMEVRSLPDKHPFSATILIFDNKVNFFTVGKELIAARIESREYSETMKSLFDTIWDSTK